MLLCPDDQETVTYIYTSTKGSLPSEVLYFPKFLNGKKGEKVSLSFGTYMVKYNWTESKWSLWQEERKSSNENRGRIQKGSTHISKISKR